MHYHSTVCYLFSLHKSYCFDASNLSDDLDGNVCVCVCASDASEYRRTSSAFELLDFMMTKKFHLRKIVPQMQQMAPLVTLYGFSFGFHLVTKYAATKQYCVCPLNIYGSLYFLRANRTFFFVVVWIDCIGLFINIKSPFST